MPFTKSTVEDPALAWFKELGYAAAHAPHFAPGELTTERDSFADVVLTGRLSIAIGRLNPAIPADAREEALRKLLRLMRRRSSAMIARFIARCATAASWVTTSG
ncbi:MAG: hypothetical protein M3Y86_13065 [Verrucomicrobiota bacterium]|nr:hypothetical protein [Verrucomicrobiota bacterium]